MGLSIGVILFVQFIGCKFGFFKSPENQQKSTLVLDNRSVRTMKRSNQYVAALHEF